MLLRVKFMDATRLLTIALSMTMALSSCDKPQSSNPLIDSGRHITPQDEDTVPGVASIGGCTATIVSDTTLVTAAHCISDSKNGGRDGVSRSKVCASNKIIGSGVCADQVFFNPSYSVNVGGKRRDDPMENEFGGVEAWATYDVVVAIFKPGTFKYYFRVKADEPAVNEKIFLVGYSQEQCDAECSKSGPKRWGRNIITDVSVKTIMTAYNKTADGVAVSPGDSGGPMFSDQCQLTGVASRMSTSGAKVSFHTNIPYSENRDWMRTLESKGAYFCGLSGEDAQHCRAGGDAVRIADGLKSSTGEERFPCTPSELANGNGGNPVNPSVPDMTNQIFIRMKSDDSRPALQFAVPRDTDSMVVCEEAPDAQACAADSSLQNIVQMKSYDTNGRKLVDGYQIKGDLSSRKPFIIIAKRKNGDVTASRTVKFDPIQ